MKTNDSISKVGKEISKVWEYSELDAVKDYKRIQKLKRLMQYGPVKGVIQSTALTEPKSSEEL